MAPFANAYGQGADAGAVHCVQPEREVRRPDGGGAGSRRRCAGDRPLRAVEARWTDDGSCTAPVDAERDQTYFLFATTPAQLDYLRFPLGGMDKPAVRELAREFGLAVAEKHDSQDICFVPQGKYADVIRQACIPRRCSGGEIVHLDGRVLGRTRGSSTSRRPAQGPRHRRARAALRGQARQQARQRVIVGPREALKTHTVRLRDVNWLGERALAEAASWQRHAGGGQGALDATAAAGGDPSVMATLSGDAGWRRVRHFARPGLRVLRRRHADGGSAGRRVHRRGGAAGAGGLAPRRSTGSSR